MTTFKARTFFLVFFLGAAFAAIIARLFVIQVLEGKAYAEQSKKQIEQRALVPAKRGNILDRKGHVLATSEESRLTMSVSALTEGAAPGPSGQNEETRKSEFVTIRRIYPYGEMAGAVLGYTGKDGGGLGGVEFFFERYLKGENGWTILNRDGKNNTYAKIGLPSKEPRNGSDVYLTIDIDMQKIVENTLQQAVTSLGACGGMCIIMEPSTGKILAMASDPSFNPNIAERYPVSQRLNKCVNYTYEPGSTFKAVTAACALQENIKKESDTLDGNKGVYDVFGEKIHDEKPYGRLSFSDAFKYSSNVCFAKVANDVGSDRLYKYAKDFGFGAQTGVQLPGEEIGIVHPVEKWSGRTRVTMAIGQEISVTALQMALLFASIANDGVLVEPRIVEKIVNAGSGVCDSARYKPVRRVISADVAKRLRTMMCKVVSSGTGVKASISGIAVGGKTGTSQKIDKVTGTYSDKKGWSSFIGFLPAESPMLLGAVIIDEPANSETGGAAAAPVFRKIMTQIISHPQLEYAEKILHQGAFAESLDAKKGRPIPDVCGMPTESAVHFLNAEQIPCELVGEKNGTVAFQSPKVGSLLDTGKKMILYTCPAATEAKAHADVAMPRCIDKDLRDAINALNLKGLAPYVLGAGTVRRQQPPYGAMVKYADKCTLSCSFAEIAHGSTELH
jgi:cell division protein FtsI (penicillin-binding protein 3)